ncbi:hypothetical protein B0T25DRAFT_535934 [Lasiosphaeria hispida]|uniref:Ankyrin n=1 Tax=Lasiosphaeria hispida TaxID=260671 RepID=A0AAJ0MJ05_9PEZI|nr:hypothetical protein B0T25DRAFT_535934 [Lasiosphaeria hispida]
MVVLCFSECQRSPVLARQTVNIRATMTATTSNMQSSLSPIELLVPEIMDGVLFYLTFTETARLGQSSRRLQQRMQSYMFKPKNNRNLAMKWACQNGVISIIDIAISFGSSPSVVSITSSTDLAPSNAKTLTLHLAARHGHSDAFRHLIELSARVDDRDVDKFTVHAFIRMLCRPVHADLLRLFLTAGLACQLSQEARDEALLSVIMSTETVALDSVRMLLDGGASPNYVRSNLKKEGSISPLSAALVSGRLDLFQILLDRGADISGPLDPHPLSVPRLPQHVPVCAAAHHMIKEGTKLMQICLDNGADINIHAPFLRHRKDLILSLTTPLLLYLDSIPSWGDANGPAGLGGLQYLLDNGASLAINAISVNLRSGRYRFQPAPSPVELLLDKWSVRELTQPSFLSALKLLVLHGGVLSRTGEILAKHDYPTAQQKDPGVISAWQDFLRTILSSPAYHQDLNTFLFTYIVSKGTLPNSGISIGNPPTDSNLTHVTILQLIEAGADINTTLTPHGPTALHALCWEYSKAEYPLNARFSWLFRWARETMTPERVEFLRFLVERCGADIGAEWEGRTPAETLKLAWDRLGEGEKARAQEVAGILGVSAEL